MKLSGPSEFVNTWPQSMAVLKERITLYLQRENIGFDDIWFPDIDIVFPEHLENKNQIKVVFLGGFLERVFETGNWPDKSYTFFCLSKRVKNILTAMFKFPDDSIQVIARDEIFPRSERPRSLNLKTDLHLVYSGRLSSQKNIEMVLAFYKILEEKLESKVRLSLFGEWDNFIPKSRGRYIIDSYKKEIENFQNKLSFKTAPVFFHGLDSEEWVEKLDDTCVLVNFSTFVCEDYGVSIAQAQSRGLPLILSDWGGHGDVVGENVLLVPVTDVAESLLPFEVIMLKAQAIAEKLLTNQLKTVVSNSCTAMHMPVYINLSGLQDIRLLAIKKYGHAICLLGQDRLSLFASSRAGKDFFKEYSLIFSGTK